jgi:predicted DNA-binding transcriptional regulator AlpA
MAMTNDDMAMPHEERGRLLGREDAGRYLGVSPSTFTRLRRSAEFPRPVMVTPTRLAWRVAELDAWLAGRPRR